LLESGLQAFLEFDEELAALRNVYGIDKDPDQFIPVEFIVVTPMTANDLGLARDGTKVPFKFKQRVRDEFVWDRLPVVKPPRQEDFEPPK
jgi:hypothetical protein